MSKENKLKPFSVNYMTPGYRTGKATESCRIMFTKYYETYLQGKCMPEIEIRVVDCQRIQDQQEVINNFKEALETVVEETYGGVGFGAEKALSDAKEKHPHLFTTIVYDEVMP